MLATSRTARRCRMPDPFPTWTLTDAAAGVWLDEFELTPAAANLPGPGGWSVRKRTLRGGPSDGVEVVEVDNGALAFTVLPTRGMGVWRGSYRGMRLGWDAPLVGPVHPKFVDADAHNGLGWLTGFDEWVCRCGLAWNGPPGRDGPWELTLHGRVANLPAHFVGVSVGADPPHPIHVVGEVLEGGLFLSRLLLRTVYTTVPGSNRLMVTDVVRNLGGRQAELQLLYHCNWGPPLLEPGARVLFPAAEVAPRDRRAAEGIDHYDRYDAPTPGYAEQVYLGHMLAGDDGWTLALLRNALGDRGAATRWRPAELPCF